jgi:hypothetical protein
MGVRLRMRGGVVVPAQASLPGRSFRFHVAGVWSGVLRELRTRESNSVHTYLSDPRQVLTLATAEYAVLAERARVDADDRYTVRLAAGEAVSVSRAVLRAPALRVPKEVLADRSVREFMVFPDDSIEPV